MLRHTAAAPLEAPTTATERAFIRQRLFKLVCNKLAAEVRRFEAHIKKTYEGVVFELMVTHNLLVRKVVELTWIIVNDRKQGVGTAIMRELCDFADRNAAEINLKPASKDDYAAITSRG